MSPAARRSTPFKIAALTTSLLLAGWYLGFGRSWLTTRAAEGGTSATVPSSGPAPTTILPSSKSGAVFRPQPGFAPTTQPVFPTTQPPATASDRDVLLYSSKSAPVFTPDKKAAAPAQAAPKP